MHRPVALLVALAWTVSGCSTADSGAAPTGGSDSPVTVTTPPALDSTSPMPSRPDLRTCTSEADGYAVEHPADWHVASGSTEERCRWFHPRPISPGMLQDVRGVAIRLRLEAHDLAEVERIERGAAAEVLDREERTVGGRPALRQEVVAGGQGLLPEGTRETQWLVDLGHRTMIASASEAATEGSYQDNVAVLDALVQSLRRVEPAPVPCSAHDLPDQVDPQPGLPAAVQDTRRAVYEAAVRCDFDRLQELIPDRGFTYSFGGGEDPVGEWRRAEAQQREPAPMRYLAGILQRPYAEREVQGSTQYAWPSAFGYDTWAQVPERDRRALAPLYDEEDLQSFARFGGYTGYRAVITEDGTWTVFVAGD